MERKTGVWTRASLVLIWHSVGRIFTVHYALQAQEGAARVPPTHTAPGQAKAAASPVPTACFL